MFEISSLKEKKISELQEIATELGIKKINTLKKIDLAYKIIDHQAANPKVSNEKVSPPIEAKQKENKSEAKEVKNKETDTVSSNRNNNNKGNNFIRKEKNHNKDNRNRYKEPDFEFDGIIESEGVLDIMQEGYGFLRSSDYNYLTSPDDIYVSQSQVRLFGLKTGDTVLGHVRPPKEGEKYFPLIKVSKINGLSPNVVRDRVSFQHLTPLFPDQKFNLADKNNTISTRIMDLFFTYWKRSKRNDSFTT